MNKIHTLTPPFFLGSYTPAYLFTGHGRGAEEDLGGPE